MNHFEQSAGVAHFLSLPPEIRDRIYELILDSEDVHTSEAPDEDAECRTIQPEDFRMLALPKLPPTSTANQEY